MILPAVGSGLSTPHRRLIGPWFVPRLCRIAAFQRPVSHFTLCFASREGLIRWNRSLLPLLAKRAGGADEAWQRPALPDRRNARRGDRPFADHHGAATP